MYETPRDMLKQVEPTSIDINTHSYLPLIFLIPWRSSDIWPDLELGLGSILLDLHLRLRGGGILLVEHI